MSTPSVLVTGVPPSGSGSAGGGVPIRREIRDFIKIEDQFSLYIQALQAVYLDPPSDVLSHYQIGGIHGMPYLPWDSADKGQRGYCEHASVLFPTWHKPYVAIFEQAIHIKAVAIAKTYTVDPARWNKAASDLRQPYWDWAIKSVPPPEVISLEQVRITKPDGSKGLVENPFLRYKFPKDGTKSFPQPYSGWPATLRCPRATGASAESSVADLTSNMTRSQRKLTRDTHALLTLVNTWDAFSNRAASTGTFTSSLETIHDSVHVNVGGNFGHMGDPAVAAFDPIFMLHHCQVDRLLALWSAMHPGIWVSPKRGQDTNTPLIPFWNTSSTKWTSVNIKPTSVFNYTYPEFQGVSLTDPARLDDHVTLIVNQLYGGSVLGLATNLAVQPQALKADSGPQAAEPAVSPAVPHAASLAVAHAASQVVGARAVFQAALATQTLGGVKSEPAPEHPSAPGDAVSTTIPDWSARVRCKQQEISNSFSVLLFLGNPPEDPASWCTSPQYIGPCDFFVNSASSHCENCTNNAEIESEGFVDLNDAILRHSGLNSLEESVVAPYLKDNLKWRVKKIDDTKIFLPSLEVIVMATPLQLLPGNIRPIAGDPQHFHELTYGRSGGSKQASDAQ